MALSKDRTLNVPSVLSVVPGLFPVQMRQTKAVPSVLPSTSLAGNQDGENIQRALDVLGTRRTLGTRLDYQGVMAFPANINNWERGNKAIHGES
jgi:hypothetical protein